MVQTARPPMWPPTSCSSRMLSCRSLNQGSADRGVPTPSSASGDQHELGGQSGLGQPLFVSSSELPL